MPDHPVFPHQLIQVAGVHGQAEARMLLDHGVDLIGLPLRLTVNAPDLPEPEAARLCRALPGKCCLITYLDRVETILELCDFLSVECVQLHGDVDPSVTRGLVEQRPALRIIKSLVIGRFTEVQLVDRVRKHAPHVWAFITDTFDLASGAEGATGLTHDWEISRRIARASPRPLILAGGLNPDNVHAAIRAVKPAGVDVHTGVEDASGYKDPSLVGAFVREARTGFLEAESMG